MKKLFLSLRHRCFTTLTHQISSPFSTAAGAGGKVPVLYKPKTGDGESVGIGTTATSTLQFLSWGRGASGQLGGGIEEIRLYPTPVANFLVPSSFAIYPPPGRISVPNGTKVDNIHGGGVGGGVVEVGISCGLFHSSLLVDGKFWIWGKGDGGRLGFGHENSLFVPTVNPHLDSIRRVALDGLHSVALTSGGQVFTWSVTYFAHCPWNCKVCHITRSGTHTAAIREAGELYTWGRDEGDDRLVLVGAQMRVVGLASPALSCGGFFTMALTEDRQVWNWGDDGKVLSWGHGGHGQLGHSSPKSENTCSGWALAADRIVYIACGGSSSAAITNNKLEGWLHKCTATKHQ